MKIIEYPNHPVEYKNVIVYPEYYCDNHRVSEIPEFNSNKILVVGVGKSLPPYTCVQVIYNKRCIGIRKKISIFNGENSSISPELRCFDVNNIRLGVVVCREILHTAIAEIFRMMKVELLTVSIGGGSFYGLQRESWIDQMCLFTDIVGCDLICASDDTKEKGGLNLVIRSNKK